MSTAHLRLSLRFVGAFYGNTGDPALYPGRYLGELHSDPD